MAHSSLRSRPDGTANQHTQKSTNGIRKRHYGFPRSNRRQALKKYRSSSGVVLLVAASQLRGLPGSSCLAQPSWRSRPGDVANQHTRRAPMDFASDNTVSHKALREASYEEESESSSLVQRARPVFFLNLFPWRYQGCEADQAASRISTSEEH